MQVVQKRIQVIMVGIVMAALAAIFSLYARPAQSAELVTIRPMSEIYVTAPQIINITDTSVQFTFETSIPIACSLIWGIDTTYGDIAVDPNMNGAAITNHNINIGNLTPNTTYHWRIQGTAASGIMYVDDDMTFTTAPASTPVEVNLASMDNGASVLGVSSSFGGVWGGNSAIDENPATAWSSNGDGNDAWIEVQLAPMGTTPHTVEVWSRYMTNNTSQIFEFTLTSNSREVFGPFTLPAGTPTAAHRFTITPTQSISSLRLDVTDSNGGNTGLTEFAVYADLMPPTSITVSQFQQPHAPSPLMLFGGLAIATALYTTIPMRRDGIFSKI
ncbi:MAG TPA: discoidin domain-containing protein [Anaerolineae bacterium]|nr:discoidin domain-containing protein [Anaerolineae bacterium]